MTRRALLAALIGLLTVVGCTSEPTPTSIAPSPTPAPPPATATASPPGPQLTLEPSVLFSELLVGVPGNNNHEFIELYNAGTEAADLNGWSLWYRLNPNQDEKLVFGWEGPAHVPGHGHYLLARAGQDVGLTGDATYDVALFERKGGLVLRDAAGEMVDRLGWGEAPDGLFAGSPVPAPEPGRSLERFPGGDQGNWVNTGDNSADFGDATSDPQNSGSPLTPASDGRLTLAVEIPAEVRPGSEVEVRLAVTNPTRSVAQDIVVSIPLPTGFQASLPAGAQQVDGRIEWTVGLLAEGETSSTIVRLTSPWTYLTTLIQGTYAEASNWPLRAYAPPLPITVTGGAIPIATARTLAGQVVTVEGIATMYTDAFYAGSTGTKFYLEDDSGGIQVYCPGGMGLVQVAIGDRVRVSGQIEVYRNSLEIIPGTYPDDVEVLEEGVVEPDPLPVTLQTAETDESIIGRLVEVAGTATRIQEFSYSYEVDLTDDQGYTQLLYVEKETGITVEPLELGRTYRVTGISEIYDTTWQVKPRRQSDFAPVYPPELMLQMSAPNSVEPGGEMAYVLTAFNHTEEPLTDVRITAGLPGYAVTVVDILDEGAQQGADIVWTIPELAAGGGSAAVRYTLRVSEGASGRIVTPAAVATAEQWTTPVRTQSLLTFIGSGVPIWAIQGEGAESPYVRSQATTEGVVTGVFPELGGFWIQQAEEQWECVRCSSGLFVLAESEVAVQVGDLARVTGNVREKSGQTMLHLLAPTDLEIVNSWNVLPAAVELDPPPDVGQAATYYEGLEGMLVQVSNPAVAVAPTTQYGETALVSAKWGVDQVMRGDPTGYLILVDDGSSATHYSLESLPFALARGDAVTNIAGPLAFTYDNYKIEPLTEPEITRTERPLPVMAPAGPGSFTVATFNVENLFDFQDPHPSDPPRPSLGEYRHRLSKTAEAIRAMGAPTVIGLQEVENIEVLQDLAQQEALIEFGYQPYLIEGTDSRGIDVGYLVRGDQASVAGVGAYPAPEGLTSRPPLLVTITLEVTGSPTVYVLNNHFTSMSEGEEATEPRRVAQAAWNATLVAGILERDPDGLAVVMGDLNSYYDSRPLDVLRESGLRHVYEFVAPDLPYSYIYEGECETLDHILVTPALYGRLVQVEVLHINADYPLPAAHDASPRRSSDHDPVIAVFRFE
jgi:predicted extracellular nuclease